MTAADLARQPAYRTVEATGKRPVSLRTVALCAAVLTALICYLSTLGCYFYCDDFTFLRFAQKSQPWNFALIRKIFTTPVAEVQPFLGCYRPVPFLLFFLQYAAAGINPWWYHLSNIICHCLCTALVFLICEQLVTAANAERTMKLPPSTMASFAASSLFACYPLNAEVVNLPNNLVTGSCAALCLTALLFFINWQKTRATSMLLASNVAFALGLLCKETILPLPLLLFAYSWVFSKTDNRRTRLHDAFAGTAWHWLMLAAYLGLRFIVLGPHVGGYGGAIGNWLSETWRQRLLSDWPVTCAFPINSESSSSVEVATMRLLLSASYAILIVSAARNWRYTPHDMVRGLLFALLGFGCLFAIVVPVWNLEPTLGGGRQFYLPAAMLAIAAGIATCLGRRKSIQAAALAIVLSCFVSALAANNHAWLEAGNLSRKFARAVQSSTAELQPPETLVLLNSPHKFKGVYLFSASAMMQAMLALSGGTANGATKVQTLSPWYILNHDQLNPARLRLLCDRKTNQFVYWNSATATLDAYQPSSNDGLLDLSLLPCNTHVDQTHQVSFQEFAVDPATLSGQCDYIDCTLTCSPQAPIPASVRPAVSLAWQTEDDPRFNQKHTLYLPVTCDGLPHSYCFAVSHKLAWLVSKHNGNLRISLPSPNFRNRLQNVKALGWARKSPRLRLGLPGAGNDRSPVLTNNEGTFLLDGPRCNITIDTSAVPDAHGAVIEISRQGGLLEPAVAGGMRCKFSSYAGSRVPIDQLRATIELSADNFPDPGIYQIEALPVSASQEPIGSASDPIYVLVPPCIVRTSETHVLSFRTVTG